MNTFNELSQKKQDEFLKFPVYVSLLAANADGTTDDKEKNTAIAFDHTKTYTGNYLLADFYAKADKVFKANWDKLDIELSKGKEERDIEIRDHLKYLNHLLKKFNGLYATAMEFSMASFKNHVSKAHHNILADFLFPLPIKELLIKTI